MRERYTGFDLFKDVSYPTDLPKGRKKRERGTTKPIRPLPEVNHEIRHTPSHKPGTQDGKK